MNLHEPYLSNAIKGVLDFGMYVLRNELKLFKEEYSKFLDLKYCIGVGNGLDAFR
jgi:hypothetical protein